VIAETKIREVFPFENSGVEEYIKFSVYDNGCGISAEKLSAIKEIIKH